MTIASIRYEGDENLDLALDLALRGITGPMTVNAWKTSFGTTTPTLHLGHAFERPPAEGWALLPADMSAADLIPLVTNWLAKADYSEPPDTDGSVKRGFALDNEEAHGAWGPGLLTIRPHWTVYGK